MELLMGGWRVEGGAFPPTLQDGGVVHFRPINRAVEDIEQQRNSVGGAAVELES